MSATVRARLSVAARWMLGNVARWKGIVGLNYHRIGDGRRSIFDRGLWSATEEGFDRQVRYLKRHFDVISPGDVASVLRVGRGRHVLVTFDDGYADNYTAAFPILKTHRVPATFFVATGFIDRPSLPWWDEIAWMIRSSKKGVLELPAFLDAPIRFDEPDREYAVRAVLKTYKRLPSSRGRAYLDAVAEAVGTGRAPSDALDVNGLWMTWDMLREMQAEGMTIGGHTVNHPILANLSREEQAREITGCESRIAAELGGAMRAFAYPVGATWAFNDDTRACLAERGVETAFSYYGGIRKLAEWDNFDIRRIAIEQSHSLADFRAMVMFPWRS
jgi:peptidoglycan/xylan/chitin deacetylase (PgdA/CDA1 family)